MADHFDGILERATQAADPEHHLVDSLTRSMDEAARRTSDRLFSRWIDRADRFGAVAAHFPRSLRCLRFVASFWAPETFFFAPRQQFLWNESAPWYGGGRTRAMLDQWCSRQIDRAPAAGFLKVVPDGSWHAGTYVDTGKPRFWSQRLPEVKTIPPMGCLPGEVLALRPAVRPGGGPLWMRAYSWPGPHAASSAPPIPGEG